MARSTKSKKKGKELPSVLDRFGAPAQLSPDQLPPGLHELREPPPQVYAWGDLPPGPWVSIVGTRSPSRQGFREAFCLARRLAKRGVTVASGGALGIDSAAHLGALAGGGRTVVLAPTWLPSAYPKTNHRLFERILDKRGAYITVSARKTPPLRFVFFRRNEVLMALSHAVVLGECPHKSGARNAMLHARSLGRPRFALPFRFGDARSVGLWAEIALQGAEVICDEGPVLRLLEEYGTFPNPAWWAHLRAEKSIPVPLAGARTPEAGAPVVPSDLSPEQARVIAAVTAGSATTDEICGDTGLAPAEVQHALLLLTLAGYMKEDSGGVLRYHAPSHERP